MVVTTFQVVTETSGRTTSYSHPNEKPVGVENAKNEGLVRDEDDQGTARRRATNVFDSWVRAKERAERIRNCYNVTKVNRQKVYRETSRERKLSQAQQGGEIENNIEFSGRQRVQR